MDNIRSVFGGLAFFYSTLYEIPHSPEQFEEPAMRFVAGGAHAVQPIEPL